jgi:large subunit ribosomal protein L22
MRLVKFLPQKAAKIVSKVLDSAVANAENNLGLDIDDLKVSQAFVDEAPTFKRFRARARGRGTRILKRNSHITIQLSDE